MANTIQIKRGTGSSVPSSLAEGELAINLDSGKFYYGSGSSVLSDFRFDSITAEKYVISSSVTHMTTSFSSGSTAFGDSAGDEHTFTGNITASGNISASGDVIANTGSFNHLIMDDGDFQANRIFAQDTDESPSATIALQDADGNNIAQFARLGSGGNAHRGQLLLKDNADTKVNLRSSGNSYFNGSSVQVGIGNDSPGKELDVTGEIRASGNITANGNIVGDNATNISGINHITASGNISSSGIITGNSIVGTLGTAAQTNITSLGTLTGLTVDTHNAVQIGDVSDSGQGTILTVDDNNENVKITSDLRLGGDLKNEAGNVTLIDFNSVSGQATFSNDVRIASDLTITAGTSGDATLIIEADTDNNNEDDLPRLWFKADGGITEGAVQLQNNTLDIINNISGAGGIRFLTGTTNNTGTTDPSTGATERLNIASDGTVSASGTIKASRYFVDGQTLADMSSGTLQLGISSGVTQIDLGKSNQAVPVFANGSITCSNNISSSATVQADTGSFNAMTKAYSFMNFYYYLSANHASELYLPIFGNGVESTVDQQYHYWHAPYNGRINRMSLSWQNGDPGDTTFRVRKTGTTPFDPDDSDDIVEANTLTSLVDDTMYHVDFSASFSKGDVVCFTVQQTGTTNTYVAGTIALEFDPTS